MFIDTVKIYIKAGDGGDGAVTFHREKYVANGGPDGGDGGKGGDIIFEANDNLSTLLNFRYKKKFIASSGENGRGNRCYGKSGKDLIIKVPRGTLIKEQETGDIIADMSESESVLIAKGGKGGPGNSHFATSKRQAPRFAKPGKRGEELNLSLELKLIADVGVIGFPNVGKSTLISMVSSAKPKIANYHFTTLTPVLGVVKGHDDNSFVMVDIPGLIEGAGSGAGLGHSFLRHVERCRMLIHLLDVSGSEGRDPVEDYKKINKELESFDLKLKELPQIIVGNKIDIATDENVDNLKKYVNSIGKNICFISAASNDGVKELMDEIEKTLLVLPPVKIYKPTFKREEIIDTNKFEIEKLEDIYFVKALWLDDLLRGTNLNDYDSLNHMHEILKKRGIIDKLKKMGIKEGDTVDLDGLEFDYVP